LGPKANKNNNDEDDKFHSPINAATDNDVSEVYSLSESVSTTTTKRDEDEEVRSVHSSRSAIIKHIVSRYHLIPPDLPPDRCIPS
jgi:hypothetical protein